MIEIDLLDEINSISKIHTLKRDDIDLIMIEFAQRITRSLRIERMSVWLLNTDETAIVSMGEYDTRFETFKKDSVLDVKNAPNYFAEISKNEILYIADVTVSPITESMNETYNFPNQIKSLLDIPLRIDGKLLGVMCFEKTGDLVKTFSEKERFFAMAISLVFASNLEARARRSLQAVLDEQLAEKETLLKEIHHRVKNNLAVVSGLIGLQSSKARDSYHRNLLDECKNKIRSIANIHDIVYQNESLSEISTKAYFETLLSGLHTFYANSELLVEQKVTVQDFHLTIEQMIPLGLIVNEVITNAYKHAFRGRKTGTISFELKQNDDSIVLMISDDGVGLPDDSVFDPRLGMEIIADLAEQLDARYMLEGAMGTIFRLVITK